VFLDGVDRLHASSSYGKFLVQLVQQYSQPVAEEFIGFAQPADLVERDFIQVVAVDGEAGGDVVFNGVEPPALLRRECGSGRRLVGEPLLIPLFHRQADRGQRSVWVECVPHERDHVRQLLAAVALHLVRFDCLVGLPQPFGLQRLRRLLNRLGQFFDLAVPQAGSMRSRVENLQRFDFVLVVVEELAEVRQQRLRLLLRRGIEAGSQQRVRRLFVDDLLGVDLC
jgi:hypothetical protein